MKYVNKGYEADARSWQEPHWERSWVLGIIYVELEYSLSCPSKGRTTCSPLPTFPLEGASPPKAIFVTALLRNFEGEKKLQYLTMMLKNYMNYKMLGFVP